MGAVLFGYVVLVIVGTAFLIGLGWSIYSLYHRGQVEDSMLMDSKQLSYIREVRLRELRQLIASNENETGEVKEHPKKDLRRLYVLLLPRVSRKIPSVTVCVLTT
jgi:hypothetical protein